MLYGFIFGLLRRAAFAGLPRSDVFFVRAILCDCPLHCLFFNKADTEVCPYVGVCYCFGRMNPTLHLKY